MIALLILILAQLMGVDVIHEHPLLLFGSLTMTVLMCIGTFTGEHE